MWFSYLTKIPISLTILFSYRLILLQILRTVISIKYTDNRIYDEAFDLDRLRLMLQTKWDSMIEMRKIGRYHILCVMLWTTLTFNDSDHVAKVVKGNIILFIYWLFLLYYFLLHLKEMSSSWIMKDYFWKVGSNLFFIFFKRQMRHSQGIYWLNQ